MFLKVKDLKKYYNQKEPLIKNLNFSVNKGDIISFIGESGSGKTTFLKCLAGLEKINSGSIELNGNILNNENSFVEPNKRKIGFVFQDYPLFPHLNVLENISINLEKNFFSKIDYILDLTNLKHLKKRFPDQLSGGEQQRVCLARALVREPELLLLDEPFSNLDVGLKSDLRKEIQSISKELNTSLIFITHDLYDAIEIADKIIFLKDGIMLQNSSVRDFVTTENTEIKKMISNLTSNANQLLNLIS